MITDTLKRSLRVFLNGVLFGISAGSLFLRAQAPGSERPDYIAAKNAAMTNWSNPPLTVTAGKDFVAVLTNDANQLNAIAMLYKTASPSVRGAVDGTMMPAAGVLKIYVNNIASAHKCTLTPVSATADPLTRASIEVTSLSICLGGQPKDTLGHAIANQGDVRALERQLTFGMLGHGDKDARIAKGTDPKYAGAIDYAVQQITNNFPKNDITAEIARESEAHSQPASTTSVSTPPSAPPPPPPPPPHPGSNVVDLAPAAPGYPPMHASRPAMDDCWWTPFVSQKFGLEMAVEHCGAHGVVPVIAAETETGISLASPGSSSPPEQVLTLETKLADQSIEAAVKQKFIMKLKVPAARQSCRAQCETKTDGMVSCKVIATGPYSKLKKFNLPEDMSEDPCPGLMTNDAISAYFLYRPGESKTKFIFYSADDVGASLDDATIHFPTQP